MVQEITTKSWGSRIAGAFFGILIGIILIIASFVLIFWNEGNGLHTAQSLQQTQQVLIAVPISPIDKNNNLKVVYFSGLATTNETLHDPLLGLTEKAIKLDREVTMYQWKQDTETKTEKDMGGSEREIKTYSYTEVWSEHLINSSEFKEQEGHKNPTSMPIKSLHDQAKKVTVGDFSLSNELISKIDGSTSIDLSKIDITPLKTKLNKPVQQDESTIYVGDDSQSPKIGDLKISESEVLPQDVSIIAQQTDHTLQPYFAPAGQSVILLEMRQISSSQMIHNAAVENQMMTWLLRLVSLIMMIIGIGLLMQPLVVIADVIPFIGTIVGFGTGAISFLLGLILWAIGTAIAWFTVRPLWAIGLIVIVIVICYLVFRSKKAKA